MGIMRTKSVEQSIRDTEEPEFQLRKALGPLDLTVFGIGVIIGTGLFVLTGEAAAGYAGPAVALSYVVGGIACALAALCYAEFASSVPVAGSAYTFSYATFGEFVAWMIGWDLILEFTLGAATVAKGWSGYLVSVFEIVGIKLPPGLYAATEGFSHDWLALIVIALVTTILVIGIKLSSMFNQVITAIKILVTLFIIGFGIWFIKLDNLTPFIPPPKSGGEAYGSALDAYLLPSLLGIDTIYGVTGIFTGAALVFFAFIGFDIVATMSEETRNPQRDMPIGILASLVICTVLYFLASIVFTGLVPYTELGTAAPAATALAATPFPAAQFVVSFAILIGLTVVVMILILGQSRVAFAMSRDNLLPLWFSRVHARFRTPYRITIITGRHLGDPRFLAPPGDARGAGEHRDARRLRAGLHRGHHSPAGASRPPAGVQGAGLPHGAHPRRPSVPLRDGLFDHRYLAQVLCLDGHRARLVLRLQPHAQPRGPEGVHRGARRGGLTPVRRAPLNRRL